MSWDSLYYQINDYLYKFCYIINESNNDEWKFFNCKRNYNSKDDVFLEIIEDIANIIGNEIYYKNNYIIQKGKGISKNNICIYSRDNQDYFNLVMYKVYEKENTMYIRYNAFGNTRYIHIKFYFEDFLSIINTFD